MSDITPFIKCGTAGGTDQTGVTRISVPVYVETLDEVLNLNTRKIATTLGITIPYVSAPFEQEDDGGFQITVNFEGSSSAPSDDQMTFELDTTMEEKAIESHPSFSNLSDTYGWNATDKAFPMTMPSAKKSNNALKASASSTIDINPLYGCESFLSVGAVFRKTYARSFIPSDVLRGIGTIVSAPSGIGQFQLPSGSKNRNWLKLAPKLRRRGNMVEITEEWMLSGPDGWNEDIYGRGQLE